MGGKGDGGLAPHGRQHLLDRIALHDNAAVVHAGEAAHIPGVGGGPAPALPHISAVAVKGGGAEQMDPFPGSALGPIDGPGQRVGDIRCTVASSAGDEVDRQDNAGTGSTGHGQAGGGHSGDGEDRAVVETTTGTSQRGVHEHHVARRVLPVL